MAACSTLMQSGTMRYLELATNAYMETFRAGTKGTHPHSIRLQSRRPSKVI